MDLTELLPTAGVDVPPPQQSSVARFGSVSAGVGSIAHMIVGADKPKRKWLGNTDGPWLLVRHPRPSRNSLTRT
jgi:hypothetical protein